jgi:two-component system, OmpR family, phosphate regulon response regulator PhoB
MGSTVLLVHGERRVRAAAKNALTRAGHAVRESDELKPNELGRAELLLASWTVLSPIAETLLHLRNQPSTRDVRVVVLAPHQDMRSAISALEYGADDCVGVPFDAEELVGRVNACLRRPIATVRAERLTAGPLTLDKAVHSVIVNGQAVSLAPTEFRLMTFFLENQGRVFSRGELLRRAWRKNIRAGKRTVDVHVRRLRQQLEPFGCEWMIQTVRGFGYRFTTEHSMLDHDERDSTLRSAQAR